MTGRICRAFVLFNTLEYIDFSAFHFVLRIYTQKSLWREEQPKEETRKENNDIIVMITMNTTTENERSRVVIVWNCISAIFVLFFAIPFHCSCALLSFFRTRYAAMSLRFAIAFVRCKHEHTHYTYACVYVRVCMDVAFCSMSAAVCFSDVSLWMKFFCCVLFWLFPLLLDVCMCPFPWVRSCIGMCECSCWWCLHLLAIYSVHGCVCVCMLVRYALIPRPTHTPNVLSFFGLAFTLV